ncbi:hypothetical protein PVAND_000904 [Polypedilum vanderplanki]|uniref:BTB domain-containing protein n=1 Tax=Polypedilum vanderplanki TaxID=319348 RepID=A0A9J6BLQ8_POLVA|nr:hypothetical protein PVAND_000904 [Polypedilum vanderplanki]
MKPKLHCKLYLAYDNYTADFGFQTIEKKIENSYQLTWKHLPGKNNNHVTCVKFKNCNLWNFPEDINIIFPNMKIMHIENSKIHSVERLQQKMSLEKLILRRNEIPFLPGDFFSNMPHLNNFKMSENRIQFVEPNIFDNAENLSLVQYNNEQFIKNGYEFKSWEPIKKALLEDCSKSPWKRYYDEKKILEAENQKLIQEKSTLMKLQNVLKDEDLKDFTIIIGSQQFKVHKLVLVANSSFFAKKIKSNPDNGKMYLMDLFDINPEIFQIILDYFYTQEFPKAMNIDYQQLMMASTRLKVKLLAKFACDKLVEKIH